mmetsp:Transcript_7599/g.14375  ORF Transcript_7599/g.14375 Transcript_7599/m.14375 type:complete len:109 (+) Transcript_7599:1596-1922(+)
MMIKKKAAVALVLMACYHVNSSFAAWGTTHSSPPTSFSSSSCSSHHEHVTTTRRSLLGKVTAAATMYSWNENDLTFWDQENIGIHSSVVSASALEVNSTFKSKTTANS